MKFTIFVDKTVKMSDQKLAAQVAHITLILGNRLGSCYGNQLEPSSQTIVVLKLNHKKFMEKLEALEENSLTEQVEYHVQVDLGLTEIPKGTITAFGYVE